ncbi:MAG: hypothetical protein K1X79_01170 [Oligoflexia bacterium]|nr:hypothetical protein [Oligoflexia bacterium]
MAINTAQAKAARVQIFCTLWALSLTRRGSHGSFQMAPSDPVSGSRSAQRDL